MTRPRSRWPSPRRAPVDAAEPELADERERDASVGILMTGKRPTARELWTWLRHP